MKECRFPNCGFQTADGCETLDKKHIYCSSCGEVIHFNIQYPDRHMGMCSCGQVVEEYRDGKIVSMKFDKQGRPISYFCLPPEQDK